MDREKALLKDWLGYNLYNRFKKYKCFLAGGAVNSLFTGNKVNDFDIYFRSKESIVDFIRGFKRGIYVAMVSDKAVTIMNDGKTIQLIFFDYFKNAEEIFKTFDFTVCMGAFDFESEEFVLGENFLLDNVRKRLIFNSHTRYPIVSLIRTEKYRQKGYEISKNEMFKIVFAIMALDIKTKAELKVQIGGMYGEKYEKLLKHIPDGEIDFRNVCDAVDKFSKESIWNKNCGEEEVTNPFEDDFDIDEVIHIITEEKIKYVTLSNGIAYKLENGSLVALCDSDEVSSLKENIYEEVSLGELVQFPLKRYKYVERDGEKLVSFFDSSFEYKVGDIVCANAKEHGLYVADIGNINATTYSDKKNKALIEVFVLSKDDIITGGLTTLLTGPRQRYKRLFVNRIVPEEEIEKLKKEGKMNGF